MIMLVALVLSFVLAVHPDPSIEKLWSELQASRAEADRNYIKFGLDSEENQFRRHRIEYNLAQKMKYRAYELSPGVRILHFDVGGKSYFRQIYDMSGD